jgi:hypothetical protein
MTSTPHAPGSSSSSHEIQCLLVLDLFDENGVGPRSITPHLPPASRRLELRVTAFGATQAPPWQVQPPRVWKQWKRAIDDMVEHAGAQLGDDQEVAHYYVAGRAPLPAYAYLGMRLGPFKRLSIVHHTSPDACIVVPCQAPDVMPAAAPVLDEVAGLEGVQRYVNGEIAVWVSTQRDLDADAVDQCMRDRKQRRGAPKVTLRAHPPGDRRADAQRLLGPADGPALAHELLQHFRRLTNCYPDRDGMVVFVSGPTILATMVGRAINPNVHGHVSWPNHDRTLGYQPAMKHPWPRVEDTPRILLVIANPANADGQRLDTDEELRSLHQVFSPTTRKRCDVKALHAARLSDLGDALREHKPHVIHIISHGVEAGLFLLDDHGREQFVRSETLRDMIREAGLDDLLLVVLNACNSCETARALGDVTDCAIGTRLRVHDDVAHRFARRFYDELLRGIPVLRAFESAHAEARPTDSEEIYCLHPGRASDLGKLVLFPPPNPTDPE